MSCRGACLATLLAWMALLAPATGQAVGADLITAEISSIANWGHDAGLGVDALSLGLTACNVGTVPLAWIAATPQHPVAATQAYRLRDGRFQMIGQSWVKHEFAALQSAFCGACAPAGASQLGTGCSTTGSANVAGSSSLLGPKSEVDATSGTFPYPFGPGNGATGPTYLRLQIPLAALTSNPGTDRYFVEGHHVAADDAQAGNGLDNASWREVTATAVGGGFNFAFAPGGATHVQEPAMFAWRHHEPTVELQVIDVVESGLVGRFWVGRRVTPLPAGGFAWDVAVHNLSSHRSAGSVTVAVPPGATITNVGFHDVDYHSGEPWDGTDWSAAVGANAVTWATTSFAANPNANALRWGTLYDFHFETDLPPTTPLAVTLGLFRPGAVANASASFAPPHQLQVFAGDLQCADAGVPFATAVEARAIDLSGAPLAGIAVAFDVGTSDATVTQPVAITDPAGRAATFIIAGAQRGTLAVTASTSLASVPFSLFVRGLEVLWLPPSGTLSLNGVVGTPGAVVVLAVDAPQPPVPTPFGTICTSVLAPGPALVIAPFATGAGGTFSFGATGLGGLIGFGPLVFQCYAGGLFPAACSIWLSNCVTITF